MIHVVISGSFSFRLKGAQDKEDEAESEIIKDSPDSPEPLNKKPRLTEELQVPDKSKGRVCYGVLLATDQMKNIADVYIKFSHFVLISTRSCLATFYVDQ